MGSFLMAFSKLYELVQAQKPKISTKWLCEQVTSITPITRVKEQWSGILDDASVRGFWIEGPMGPPVPLLENEALIVLARSLPKPSWRRFVYAKELMHAFDTEEEKADTADRFDAQVDKLGDPTADMTPQFRAEVKAFWRALAVLCPEANRTSFEAQLNAGKISIEVVAATLRIPAPYAQELFRDDYLSILNNIIGE